MGADQRQDGSRSRALPDSCTCIRAGGAGREELKHRRGCAAGACCLAGRQRLRGALRAALHAHAAQPVLQRRHCQTALRSLSGEHCRRFARIP